MYSLLIHIASLFLRIAALWNHKIRLFVDGRKNWETRLSSAVSGSENIIWFHVASMGEFEEARPIIETARERYPEMRILLTFFSPSGYEVRKNWPVADWVFYLPLDTSRAAKRFLDIVRPRKAVFTIGEFWFNYLKQLRVRGIETYIMSLRATSGSPYVKWYGSAYRRLLRTSYKVIMVKDSKTEVLLKDIGCKSVVMTGDARFDRVIKVASSVWNNPIVDCWSAGQKVFIAGSTHDEENEMVIAVTKAYPALKCLVIPHEIDMRKIRNVASSIGRGAVLYSEVEDAFSVGSPDDAVVERLKAAQTLIVDKVGMLSKLYRYGTFALVGGGFTTLPHSVIEAAVYGIPVAMGPLYEKNLQFVELLELKAATPVNDNDDAVRWVGSQLENPLQCSEAGKIAYDYCRRNGGATDRIMNLLFADRLQQQ